MPRGRRVFSKRKADISLASEEQDNKMSGNTETDAKSNTDDTQVNTVNENKRAIRTARNRVICYRETDDDDDDGNARRSSEINSSVKKVDACQKLGTETKGNGASQSKSPNKRGKITLAEGSPSSSSRSVNNAASISEDIYFINKATENPDMDKEAIAKEARTNSVLSCKQKRRILQYDQALSEIRNKKTDMQKLANHPNLDEKLDGRKLQLLRNQMASMSENESLNFNMLSNLLELTETGEILTDSDEKATIIQLLKNNMENSKSLNDKIVNAKNTVSKIFDHKENVADVVESMINANNKQ